MSIPTQLVCTLDIELTQGTNISYKLWIVDVVTSITIDTIQSSALITASNIAIYTINYDFHGHYFSMMDQAGNSVTSGVIVAIGSPLATSNL